MNFVLAFKGSGPPVGCCRYSVRKPFGTRSVVFRWMCFLYAFHNQKWNKLYHFVRPIPIADEVSEHYNYEIDSQVPYEVDSGSCRLFFLWLWI